MVSCHLEVAVHMGGAETHRGEFLAITMVQLSSLDLVRFAKLCAAVVYHDRGHSALSGDSRREAFLSPAAMVRSLA